MTWSDDPQVYSSARPGSPNVGVVIPTVDGREDMLRRCLDAYHSTLDGVPFTLVVYRNAPTCGAAWNAGADLLLAEHGVTHLHMGADDVHPRVEWFDYCLDTTDLDGAIPAPLIHTGMSGLVESCGVWGYAPMQGTPVPQTMLPFCKAEWWQPIPPIHYYSDNSFSSLQQAAGRVVTACPGAVFDHWWSQPGRVVMHSPQWTAEEQTWRDLHATLGLA